MRTTTLLLLALVALSCSQPAESPEREGRASEPEPHSGPLPHEELWRQLLGNIEVCVARLDAEDELRISARETWSG